MVIHRNRAILKRTKCSFNPSNFTNKELDEIIRTDREAIEKSRTKRKKGIVFKVPRSLRDF